MRRGAPLVLIFGVILCVANPASVLTQQLKADAPSVKLYSDIKYRGEHRPGCLNLRTSAAYSIWSTPARGTCDLYYGMLQVGDEKDWVQSASGQSDRSVIKDLGVFEWTSSFKVPVVDPLPKLKPGEQRQVTIDASGADGADGAAGKPGAPGQPGADADGVVRERPVREPQLPAPLAIPARPKRDGKPKVDPLFVKAVAGHLYVIHVVDETADFYALFRIDALERGDNCTISWQVIPNPDIQTTVRK